MKLIYTAKYGILTESRIKELRAEGIAVQECGVAGVYEEGVTPPESVPPFNKEQPGEEPLSEASPNKALNLAGAIANVRAALSYRDATAPKIAFGAQEPSSQLQDAIKDFGMFLKNFQPKSHGELQKVRKEIISVLASKPSIMEKALKMLDAKQVVGGGTAGNIGIKQESFRAAGQKHRSDDAAEDSGIDDQGRIVDDRAFDRYVKAKEQRALERAQDPDCDCGCGTGEGCTCREQPAGTIVALSVDKIEDSDDDVIRCSECGDPDVSNEERRLCDTCMMKANGEWNIDESVDKKARERASAWNCGHCVECEDVFMHSDLDHEGLCSDCREAMQAAEEDVCPSCGNPLHFGSPCHEDEDDLSDYETYHRARDLEEQLRFTQRAGGQPVPKALDPEEEARRREADAKISRSRGSVSTAEKDIQDLAAQHAKEREEQQKRLRGGNLEEQKITSAKKTFVTDEYYIIVYETAEAAKKACDLVDTGAVPASLENYGVFEFQSPPRRTTATWSKKLGVKVWFTMPREPFEIVGKKRLGPYTFYQISYDGQTGWILFTPDLGIKRLKQRNLKEQDDWDDDRPGDDYWTDEDEEREFPENDLDTWETDQVYKDMAADAEEEALSGADRDTDEHDALADEFLKAATEHMVDNKDVMSPKDWDFDDLIDDMRSDGHIGFTEEIDEVELRRLFDQAKEDAAFEANEKAQWDQEYKDNTSLDESRPAWRKPGTAPLGDEPCPNNCGWTLDVDGHCDYCEILAPDLAAIEGEEDEHPDKDIGHCLHCGELTYRDKLDDNGDCPDCVGWEKRNEESEGSFIDEGGPSTRRAIRDQEIDTSISDDEDEVLSKPQNNLFDDESDEIVDLDPNRLEWDFPEEMVGKSAFDRWPAESGADPSGEHRPARRGDDFDPEVDPEETVPPVGQNDEFDLEGQSWSDDTEDPSWNWADIDDDKAESEFDNDVDQIDKDRAVHRRSLKDTMDEGLGQNSDDEESDDRGELCRKCRAEIDRYGECECFCDQCGKTLNRCVCGERDTMDEGGGLEAQVPAQAGFINTAPAVVAEEGKLQKNVGLFSTDNYYLLVCKSRRAAEICGNVSDFPEEEPQPGDEEWFEAFVGDDVWFVNKGEVIKVLEKTKANPKHAKGISIKILHGNKVGWTLLRPGMKLTPVNKQDKEQAEKASVVAEKCGGAGLEETGPSFEDPEKFGDNLKKQETFKSVMEGLREDEELRREILAFMDRETDPEELKKYKQALELFDKAIADKKAMIDMYSQDFGGPGGELNEQGHPRRDEFEHGDPTGRATKHDPTRDSNFCDHDWELVSRDGPLDENDWECRNCGKREVTSGNPDERQPLEEGGHIGFKKLEKSLAGKPGVKDPGALAAAIGRKKYGAGAMKKAAASGKSLKESMEEWPKAKPGDVDVARHLVDFIVNEDKLYPQIKDIRVNLTKKMRKGIYDKTLAAKLWFYLATRGAKMFENELPIDKINPETRKIAAIMLERYFFNEVEFDAGIPGKVVTPSSSPSTKKEATCHESRVGFMANNSNDLNAIIDKVEEANRLVTFDDPNMSARMSAVAKDIARESPVGPEELKDLAEYFIDKMTDESQDYQDVSLEPDSESGRSALEASGMSRAEAYPFRRLDPVELGRAVLMFYTDNPWS